MAGAATTSRSLLQVFLDNSFERARNPENELLRADTLRQDLEAVGIRKLHPREVTHLQRLIINNSHPSQRELAYKDVVSKLMQEDFVHSNKVGLNEKLIMQQQRKEKQSREKLHAMDKGWEGIKQVEQKISNEAQRRIGASPNGTAGEDNVDVVFLVENKLREVLDKRRARLLDAFKEMDLEGKGHISKVDLGKGLTRLGVHLSRSQLDKFFEVLDFDHSGSVEYREFSKVMQSASLQRQQDKLKRGQSPPQSPTDPRVVSIPQNNIPQHIGSPSHVRIQQQPGHAIHPQASYDGSDMEGLVRFQVSSQSFVLHSSDIIRSVPNSVLGHVVANYKDQLAHKTVFLDLNPDIFQFIISRCILHNSCTETSDALSGTVVNEHSVNHMCRTLSIDPSVVLRDRIPQSTIPTTSNDITSETSEPNQSNVHEPKKSHRVVVQMSKVLSSKSEGIEIHVREGETLVLETVGGDGQLLMDVFSGEEMELKKECKASKIVVFDSRAFFHIKGLDAIRLDATFQGPAHYRFRVISFERSKGVLSPATLNVSFSILSHLNCACCRQTST